jgi:hypothetical protein
VLEQVELEQTVRMRVVGVMELGPGQALEQSLEQLLEEVSVEAAVADLLGQDSVEVV